jgi:general stress protein CsbA
MENEKYLKDIQDIKDMMSKSSQFLSLSGFSGILAGIYALIGAAYANSILPSYNRTGYELSRNSLTYNEEEITIKLFITAALVVILSIITGLLLSSSKAKKHGESLWTNTSRTLIINFSIPLIAGGIFALILLQKEYYGLIAPITLLFYGLGCVSASRHTFRDVRYLGITLIVIGLFATYFMGYGLYFWTLGFGICHIVYGAVMHFKYDRN